jgi:hypothetical protein
MAERRKQRSKKKVNIFCLIVVILLVGFGAVYYLVTNNVTAKDIYVTLKPTHDRYQLGDSIDIEINTTRSDIKYSTDKWFNDIEICRIPNGTTPSEIIQDPSLASSIAGKSEYSGGYRQFIPVFNYSTEKNMFVTWNCTVTGIVDPNAIDYAAANNVTYIAPSGYYFIYLSWYVNDGSNVWIINHLEPSSFFYLDSISPSINWTYDSATKVVNYSVALGNDLRDRTIDCDQSIVGYSMDDTYITTRKTDSNAYFNESYTLSPNSQSTKSYTMSNVTLTKEVGGSVIIYVIYKTSVGREFCSVLINAWS